MFSPSKIFHGSGHYRELGRSRRRHRTDDRTQFESSSLSFVIREPCMHHTRTHIVRRPRIVLEKFSAGEREHGIYGRYPSFFNNDDDELSIPIDHFETRSNPRIAIYTAILLDFLVPAAAGKIFHKHTHAFSPFNFWTENR